MAGALLAVVVAIGSGAGDLSAASLPSCCAPSSPCAPTASPVPAPSPVVLRRADDSRVGRTPDVGTPLDVDHRAARAAAGVLRHRDGGQDALAGPSPPLRI